MFQVAEHVISRELDPSPTFDQATTLPLRGLAEPHLDDVSTYIVKGIESHCHRRWIGETHFTKQSPGELTTQTRPDEPSPPHPISRI
jgi:hypothetical protein